MAGPPDLPGKEDIKALPSGPVDLSPAVTTVAFETVLPLLRVPLPAGDDDDLSKGPYVLAFKDEDSWRRAWRRCEDKVAAQCETGARMGCSISAANLCKIPWWKTIFPFLKISARDEAEREACEEREMMACLAASKENCTKYARETCEPVFAELRIAERDQVIDPRFNGKRLPRLRRPPNLQRKSSLKEFVERGPGAPVREAGSFEQVHSSSPENMKRCTNFRGKRLMEDGSCQRSWDSPVWHDTEENVGSPPVKETVLEGWEGGLVRPKFDPKKPEQVEEIQVPDAISRKSLFWKDLQENVLSRLREIRSH